MKIRTLLLLTVLSPSFIFGNETKPKDDFFANLTTNKYQKSTHYEKEQINPPKLSKTPVFKFDNRSEFTALKKLKNNTEVKAALAKMLQSHQVYLQDIAPKIKEVPRQRLNISKMQFRLESDADQKDFNHTLSGKGEWKNVSIPYYHGPQGRSTAWYRSEITVDESLLNDDEVMLHFNGADYYCDAYVNGHHVGFHEGMLDQFEFAVKKYLKVGKNTILVRLKNDYSMLGGNGTPRFWGHKIAACNSPGWDDPVNGWNCAPSGYGLNQDLYLESRSFVYIEDVFPRPLLAEDAVELWIELEMPNGNLATAVTIETSIFGQNFKTEVVKRHKKRVSVVGGRCLYKIKQKIPKDKLRLWTPENPWLYQVQVKLYDQSGKKLLDTKQKQFGMRSFVIAENSNPKGRMYLNGKEIRLRGTNTMGYLQQDVMAHDWDRLINDLLLNKLTNMNFIRTTQRSVQEEVYKYADRLGVMMQADFPIFAYLNNKQFSESLMQVGKMERLLRSHPSVVIVTYLNESMAEVKPHAISRLEYERFFDAADLVVGHENPDRAIKYVEGDYQGPNKGLLDEHCYNIWYHGHGVNLAKLHQGGWMSNKKNWMYGCGEFGAEGLDPVNLMMRRYPANWLPKGGKVESPWTPNRIKGSQTWRKHWDFFETQDNMTDWVSVSHEHQTWGVKMVTEAFRRMPKMNTFAIHLFIDAWPNGWLKTIVDCERKPKPAWYAYRDALTPLSVQLRTDRTAFRSGETFNFEAWVCNDTQFSPETELRYQIEKDGKVISSGKVKAKIPTIAQGSQFQGWLPVTAPKTIERTTFTVRMGLFAKDGKQIHEAAHVLDLYPAITKPTKRVYLIGKENAQSNTIKDAFGITFVTSGAVLNTDSIVISDFSAYTTRKTEIDKAVKKGAKCLILPMFGRNPVAADSESPDSVANDAVTGNRVASDIIAGDTKINWSSPTMSRWIVFRNTKHHWMKGTRRNDFKFWCYKNSNDTRPIQQRFRCFKAKGFNDVLTEREQLVVAEKTDGKGRWTIFQLDINGRGNNPACTTLLSKALFSAN